MPFFNSRSPLRIVGKEMPVACDTRVAPPRPSALASVAAHLRRMASSNPSASARYFATMSFSAFMPVLWG